MLLKQISPINMYELKKLIDKTDNAANSVKDKDIILFMGETGSGKSTTIHYLAGSTMEKKKY